MACANFGASVKVSMSIAIEASWRGSILDTVRPIATLPLQEDPNLAGQLNIGAPFVLKLTNGDFSTVWCARTAYNRFVLDITTAHQPSIHVEADAPISSVVRLPDEKLYEFNVRVEA
jgi:hypothetical protein